MQFLKIRSKVSSSNINFSFDKVGINRIRMRRTGTHSTTILQSMISADLLLQDWHMCTSAQIECEFEVIFIDGYVLRGKYDFVRKARSRPSLKRHLERICGEMMIPKWNRTPQGATDAKFLDVYELGQ